MARAYTISFMNNILNLKSFREINFKNELLAGLTVAMTMIPESLSFAILAGLSPLMGLLCCLPYGNCNGSFRRKTRNGIGWSRSNCCCTDGFGVISRRSVPVGSCCIGGYTSVSGRSFKLGKFVRLIPQPVMYGFLNGLAIIILWLR